MRNILVAGNWKMNGDLAMIKSLVSGIVSGVGDNDRVDVLVCPPFPYLAPVAAQLAGSSVLLGAQSVSQHGSGAFTGEVAPKMLADLGCLYVIVGHSERRALYGENSDLVAEKFRAAQNAGLTPILCVGETLEEREAMATESVISAQVAAVIAASGIEAFKSAVIAYEPVWAIGTGKVATPEQAQDAHFHIRSLLAVEDADIAAGVQILYGGSMKGENAPGLLTMPDIDGGLIGGASLKSADFLAIVQAAVDVTKG
ncbi:MAG: triose-phosphate isomerase [Woeseiaceae bacterium]|nr:triose-phosphate isomerase [Woeseiaceae bacterium]